MADASSESEEEYESMEYASDEYISSSISEEDVDFRSHTFKTQQQRDHPEVYSALTPPPFRLYFDG